MCRAGFQNKFLGRDANRVADIFVSYCGEKAILSWEGAVLLWENATLLWESNLRAVLL